MFAFVVSAAKTVAAMAADRVDLIDEDEARSVLLSLLEHVANARGAHADEHLDEIRSADGEEWHVGFAGDRPREERLAGSRRPDHEDALRDASAQLLKFLWILKELDEFGDLFLGLLDAGHILEGDSVLLLREHARLALAEIQRAPSGHLDLRSEEEIEDHEEEGDREEADDCGSEHVGFRLYGGRDICGSQRLLHLRAIERHVDRSPEGNLDFFVRRQGFTLIEIRQIDWVLRPSSTMISTGRCSVETIFPALSRSRNCLLEISSVWVKLPPRKRNAPPIKARATAKSTRPRQFSWGSPPPGGRVFFLWLGIFFRH